MYDRTNLAEEIADAIDRCPSGEISIRWTTEAAHRVVEVVRSGTWSTEAESDLWDLVGSDLPQVGSSGSEISRRARNAAIVQQIRDLIEKFGIDAVKLDTVQTLLGLTKTTAYHRLTEARELWREAAAS